MDMAITYTKLLQNIPNGREVYHNIPFQIFQNCDFWFERISSGNPVPSIAPWEAISHREQVRNRFNKTLNSV
jgi:hypothetical protein